MRAVCSSGACLSKRPYQVLSHAILKTALLMAYRHAELILAAKEQNKSAHSLGRKNAMQMLLEAKDENGAMCLLYKDLFMLVL